MPITPYLRPQDTITQILRNTATPAIERRNPVVIGPQYLLQTNDGRALNKTTFSSLGVADYGYKLASGAALDMTLYRPHATSAKLFGEDLEAKVGTAIAAVVASDVNAIVRYGATSDTLASGTNNTKNFKGGSLHTNLGGRAVKVGDTIAVTTTSDAVVRRRKVVQLLPRMSTPTGVNTVVGSNALTAPAILIEMAAGSNTNYTFATTTSAAAPVGPFLFYGGLFSPNTLLTKRLGETFVCTATTAGSAGTAVFSVTSLASGETRTITPSYATNVLTFDLSTLGAYPGVNIQVTRAGGTAQAGDTFTAKLFPIYTAPTAATVTNATAYTPTANRQYVIETSVGNAAGTLLNTTFRVYDSTGAESIQTGVTSLLTTTQVSLGTSGVTVTLPESGFYYKGHKFVVTMTAGAPSATEFNGVKLSGPIIDVATYTSQTLSAEVFQSFTGELTNVNLATGSALTATSSTTSYAATLGLPKVSTGLTAEGISAFSDGIGKVFLSYKAAVIPGELEGVISVTRSSEMVAQVGEPHLDNWLGRGVFEAFNGNQKQRVYALRTLGDTVEDFTAALRKIRSTDVYYALAVMTDNIAVKTLVISHCEEMSNKYNKNFRRCYVGTDSPGQYEVWGQLAGGGYRLGSVASQTFTIKVEDRALGAFTADDVGSLVKIPSEGIYTITHVYNGHEVRLDCPTALAVTNVAFSLIRTDTAANAVRFLSETAQLLSSRRCVNVWTDRATTSVGYVTSVVPNKFIAAEVAGLRCALLPQQGLTMTEIESISKAPAMYTRFTPEQLDTIASYGNMVVTQEAEGGDIFIRHQLTTSTNEGALAYEDNVGVIVDEFSYRVKDTFRAYIGKRNATSGTIVEIKNKLRDLAEAATKTDIAQLEIGPMALRFFDEEGKEGAVTARIDGVLADHILTYVKLRVPLPLNGIDHYIDVETSVDL